MRTRAFAAIALAACLLAPAGAAAQPFHHLAPGQHASLQEQLPVQYVFVGYTPAQVPEAAFRSVLPARQDPVVVERLLAGIEEPAGVHYRFDHRVTYAPTAWEDAFFAELGRLAVPQASVDGEQRTLEQDTYNVQAGVLQVGQNWLIDAPTVEHWLAANPPPGVDTTRNTVYLVNWWGRRDFRFHTYTKTGEPDPDTGFDFGAALSSTKVMAWGGTPPDDPQSGDPSLGQRRVWFYDLSAGPDYWTGSYDISVDDIDGDGVEDYRLPNVWEYLLPGGYRPAARLATDLGLVARYAALDGMMAASPLFPAYYTPPRLPNRINLDLNVYEGLNGVQAASPRYLKPDFVVQRLTPLLRGVELSADVQDLPFAGRAKHCWTRYVLAQGRCYRHQPAYLPGNADLFLYAALHVGQLRDGDAGWEALSLNYATGDFRSTPFLGVTYENFLDGTQSGIWNALSPGILEAGYGLTTTNVHEYGHLFGLDHPHDGYDSETGPFTGSGATWLAWVADESNTAMGYVDLNWDFSQFDRDNLDRWRGAAYVTFANRIAARVLGTEPSGAGATELAAADDAVGAAQAALDRHDYPATLAAGKAAYDAALAAAAKAGVSVRPSDPGWALRPRARRLPKAQALVAAREHTEQAALARRLRR